MKTVIVSFSGGRTSAYMAKWLIENKANEFDLKFVFANTGLEHPKTLDFIDKCDRAWNLDLVWIEAQTHKKLGKGQTYNVVNYKTAARNGEPYKLLASIEGIPCPTRPICTDRLKSAILIKYRNSFGKKAVSAIGIRVDEIDRMNPHARKNRIIYPLISMKPTGKQEILRWFKNNDFDLEVDDYLGNCVTCWKKTDRKLFTIAKNNKSHFDCFIDIEVKYSDILSKKDGRVNGVKRNIFRKHRDCADIINHAENVQFIPWSEVIAPDQLDLFGVDQGLGCEESCEAF